MSAVLTCNMAVIADTDGNPKVEVYYDVSANRLVLRPATATIAVGLAPNTIGLRWDGSRYVADPEIVLDGPFSAITRPANPGTRSEAITLVFVEIMRITDSFGFLRGHLRWLPMSEQAALGRNYKSDVVELATVNSLTGVALMSATSPAMGETHNPIEAVVRRYYPFS